MLHRLLFVVSCLGLVVTAAVGAGCEPDRCLFDGDCLGGRCAPGGDCVSCLDSADCGEDSLCCNGTCRVGTVEDLCGCAADPHGAGPTRCEEALCIVDGAVRADRDTVGQGVCACPCDPARGGTLCAAEDASSIGFSCSCDRTDPVGTCEGPAVDAAGIPHRPADTCSPQNACVCFAAGTVCSGSADCTWEGCVDLVHDATNCGVAGRSCSDDATGTDGGTCNDGGCSCNAASDCEGDGLNVDTCIFVGARSQCVCNGYRAGDVAAACPMGLACVADGCQLGADAFATQAELILALHAR